MKATKLDSDGYPTVCAVCGVRIVKTKDRGGLCFYKDDVTGEVWSWHMPCGSPFPRKEAA